MFPPLWDRHGALPTCRKQAQSLWWKFHLIPELSTATPRSFGARGAQLCACCETELHCSGMQPWDALLDSPLLEMGEDVPFLANQLLALCVRPVLLPGLQLSLSRAKSPAQVLEEAQVPLSLCEEPCSLWSVCFHVSPWMFRPEFAFSSPTALPLQWEELTRGGEHVG